MREFLAVGSCCLWLTIPTLGVCLPGAVRAGTAEKVAPRTTTVKQGEDCQAIVRRVYGDAPGAMARFHSANPQLGGLPHVLHKDDIINIPGLRLRRPDPGKSATRDHERQPGQGDRPPEAEPARLSFVGPEVRTRERREGWTEALPDQPVGRRMRIKTSAAGGAEVTLQGRGHLQMDPNATLVIDNLPKRRTAGEVDLVEGSVRADVTPNPPIGQPKSRLGSQPASAPLTVHTPSADLKVRGGARIEAEGQNRSLVAVYEGAVAVRAHGSEVKVPAGQGTLVVAGSRPRAPQPLLPAPSLGSEDGPLLVVALGTLGDRRDRKGEATLSFEPVGGAEQYLVEVARDERFNDRRAGGEIVSPPFRIALSPGQYQARVSAIDGDRLVGPPSAPRQVRVISLRTDATLSSASPPGAPTRLLFSRPLRTTLVASGGGFLLAARVNDGPEVDCTHGRTFVLGPGEHLVTLSSTGTHGEVLISVSPPPPPPPPSMVAQKTVEPLDLPVPLSSPGFPGRALSPRTRAYALLGIGASQGDRSADVYRVDLGGEVAFFNKQFSLDLNLPLLYHDNGPYLSGPAVGDVSVGFRAVALTSASGRAALGPLLRLQLPSGTFDRGTPDVHPVVIDPAIAGSLVLGPVGLLTSQGPTAVVAIATPQLRWSMSYAAEYRLSWLSLLAQLDGAIGLAGGAPSGAALGGGARIGISQWHLLFGVRGGLGDGGQQVFGRYYASLGAEWVR